ncbi:MAG: tetratricopeptide repeat protein [Anaerolineales bacterium]|nr:tetratricopeptide repeat protein [Anaerolineales bacterium]
MNESSLKQLLEQANTAINERDYALAQARYRQVLAEIPAQTQNPVIHSLRLQAWEKLGDLLYKLGNQDEALHSFRAYQQEAFTAAQKTHALVLLGNQLRHMGQLDEAMQTLQEALQLAKQTSDEVGTALAYQGIGGVHYQSGRIEESISYMEKALPGFIKVGDREQQLRTRNWQGLAYMRLGKTDLAINALTSALKLARLVDIRSTSIVLGNLGEAHQELYDMEQALQYHQEAMHLAEGTNLIGDMADLARNLGFELVHLGRLEEGLAYLYQALSISEETGQLDIKLQSLYSLALAELQQGNIEMAQTHAQVLREIAEERKARAYEADALHALGLCYKQRGDMATAMQFWQQASFLAHETEQRMLLWQIHGALADIAPDAGLADVHRRIAAEVIEQIAYPIQDLKLRQKFLNAAPVRAALAQN